jgi:hypothetical protein
MRKRFSRKVVNAIDEASIMGVRAGSDHRFIGVWPVVVGGRAYARSWGVSPDGWFHAFLEHANGAIQILDREIRVRAVPARGERVRDKVEDAYAQKFTTKASRKWIRGFKTARRRAATIEFVPR